MCAGADTAEEEEEADACAPGGDVDAVAGCDAAATAAVNAATGNDGVELERGRMVGFGVREPVCSVVSRLSKKRLVVFGKRDKHSK